MVESSPIGRYQAPVFVVGMPRSGTTLIQGILCNTGHYFPMPETHFFSRVGYGLPEMINKCDRKKILKRFKKKSRIELDWASVKKAQTQKEIFEYLLDTFNKENMDKFLEKTPRHVFFYSKILEYYPSARFVCMIREPKNVVSSMKINSKAERKSVIRMASLYNKIAGAILRIKNNQNVFLIKYEELTSNTDRVLKNAFNFIGIPYGEAVKEKIAAPPEIVQEHEFWKNRNIEGETIKINDPERWKMGLSHSQADLVGMITRKYAKKFGYKQNYNVIRACFSFIRDIKNLSSHNEIKRLFSKIHG
jgi:hypothetical protein